MRFDIITLFPHSFDSYLNESLLARARHKKILSIHLHDLRGFTHNRHLKVDDRPFGGGPGMVLQVEPIYNAVQSIQKKSRAKRKRVILFSARGKKLTSAHARKLASYDQLIFICGRYEGVDERVARYIADEEISIGGYVLSGGELPAIVTVETIARFLPGFLGTYESLETIKGSYPVYTRPEVFFPKKKTRWSIPKVLISGNHKDIKKWRQGK